MVMFNNPGYYHALDNTFSPEEEMPVPISPETEGWSTEMTHHEMGQSANPMQNQIQALNAAIRLGAGRVEINFPGAGKGNQQSATPESYGMRERRDIRELAKAADVKTTTHATFGKQGFSGFDPQRGFNQELRYQNIKEIRKAIEFAAEASTGGAIVFHTGEWNRPISETWGHGGDKDYSDVSFRAFEEEDDKAVHYMVDERTGNFVSAISKDKELFRPKFKTAKDLAPDRIGQYDPDKGDVLAETDYIDVNGKYIDERDPQRLFERIPVWNSERTAFEAEKLQWQDVERETERWNDKHPEKQLTPAEMFVRIEEENRILQLKGSSLFHGQRYDEYQFQEKKIREALEFYKKLDESLPEEEKWKLMTQRGLKYSGAHNFTTTDRESIPEMLTRELKDVRDNMRYVHEASASADAQAKEREELLGRIKTVKDYGLEQSSEGVARAGMYAWEQTQRHKKDLENPLFIAPENWQQNQYGSHPDEMTELVKASRERMAKELMASRGMDQEQAKKAAQESIRATIDIGHLNLWRQHLMAKPGESEEQRNKRFNKWAIDKTKMMIKEGIIGHVHIADNLGWDDEHLTPGEGNAPIREFVKEIEKAGIKDVIVEPGSFNSNTALLDSKRYLGSPVYAAGTPFARPMGQFREAHFGYSGPSNYIVGAYSPSNEWKLWSEVPLE